MTGFLRIGYWLMVAVQFFAIWDGAKVALGIGNFFSLVLAVIFANVPLVGALTGFDGATHA